MLTDCRASASIGRPTGRPLPQGDTVEEKHEAPSQLVRPAAGARQARQGAARHELPFRSSQPGSIKTGKLRLATVCLAGLLGCHICSSDYDEWLIGAGGLRWHGVQARWLDSKEYPKDVGFCCGGRVRQYDKLAL